MEIPSVNEVRQQMSIGQSLIIVLMLLAYQIWNMDETAFTWAIGPQHAFVSEDARRTAGEQSNTKQRITVAVMANALGKFAPLFIILRHSESSEESPDQTGMTVVQGLN